MKNVYYKLNSKKAVLVEVKTIEQEELIKELNRDTDSFSKSELTYRQRTISTTVLSTEEMEFEIEDNSLNAMDKLIEKEKYQPLYDALDLLTDKQRTVVILHSVEGKSFRKIASIKGLNEKTIRETFNSAITKLQEKLKDFR